MTYNIKFFICTLCISYITSAFALDKDFGQWHSYTAHKYTEKGISTCNMYTRPKTIDPRRINAQFNTTNRPKKLHRMTINMGVEIDTASPITLQIKGKTYTLQGYGTYAIIPTKYQNSIIYKMKMGAEFNITATTKQGIQISDTYPLMGFTRALKTIDKYC